MGSSSPVFSNGETPDYISTDEVLENIPRDVDRVEEFENLDSFLENFYAGSVPISFSKEDGKWFMTVNTKEAKEFLLLLQKDAAMILNAANDRNEVVDSMECFQVMSLLDDRYGFTVILGKSDYFSFQEFLRDVLLIHPNKAKVKFTVAQAFEFHC